MKPSAFEQTPTLQPYSISFQSKISATGNGYVNNMHTTHGYVCWVYLKLAFSHKGDWANMRWSSNQ